MPNLVARTALRARNVALTAFRPDQPQFGRTPKDLVWACGRCELWRYRSKRPMLSPPLVFVFSLVSRSYIIDLQPGNSFVERLQAAGFDVWLVDWAPASAADAADTLADYVEDYLPAALTHVLQTAQTDDVNLLGYCSSGLLTLMYAASRADAPVRSLANIATPIDFSAWPALARLATMRAFHLDAVLDDDGNVPPWAIRQLFRLLRPTGDLHEGLGLLEHGWNDRYTATHRAMRRWGDDHVPFPGAAARQVLDDLIRDNALVSDTFRLRGRRVSLRDVRLPMLSVVAQRDHIVPPEVAGPIEHLVRSNRHQVLRLDAGHIGMVVGRSAASRTVPEIVSFIQRHTDRPAPAGRPVAVPTSTRRT
jgi:polyhydroxyalkanoate synthase